MRAKVRNYYDQTEYYEAERRQTARTKLLHDVCVFKVL